MEIAIKSVGSDDSTKVAGLMMMADEPKVTTRLDGPEIVEPPTSITFAIVAKGQSPDDVRSVTVSMREVKTALRALCGE